LLPIGTTVIVYQGPNSPTLRDGFSSPTRPSGRATGGTSN
jgi:hypothetical protein